MNNIYLFEAPEDDVTWDCFESHIVIAENAQNARKIILSGRIGDEGMIARKNAKYKKIGTSELKSQIIHSSFRNG